GGKNIFFNIKVSRLAIEKAVLFLQLKISAVAVIKFPILIAINRWSKVASGRVINRTGLGKISNAVVAAKTFVNADVNVVFFFTLASFGSEFNKARRCAKHQIALGIKDQSEFTFFV